MKKIFEIKYVAAMCSAILMIAAMIVLSAQKAEANVCFLPDGEECNDGVTRGFWPGSTPDSDIEPERQSGNCDNFTDTTRRNECGQLCQVCSIAGDKNYGKYLCPSVPATGCAQACDCTLSEGAKNQKLASNPCMECEQCTSSECSEVNRGKWRCAINPKCQRCQSSGYNKRYDSSEVTASNGTCSRTQCEPCSDKYNTLEAREWYKCYECDENIYTHNENNLTDEDKEKHCDMNNKCGCFVGCDCFGYNYSLNDCTSEGKEAKDECKGKGGTWYKECVCQGGVTQKKGEGQCWDYNDKCTDASGNKHYNQKENVRSGYKIEGGECVKEQECIFTFKDGTTEKTIEVGADGETVNINFKSAEGNTVPGSSYEISSSSWLKHSGLYQNGVANAETNYGYSFKVGSIIGNTSKPYGLYCKRSGTITLTQNGEKCKGKQLTIKVEQNGGNQTAETSCSCVKYGEKDYATMVFDFKVIGANNNQILTDVDSAIHVNNNGNYGELANCVPNQSNQSVCKYNSSMKRYYPVYSSENDEERFVYSSGHYKLCSYHRCSNSLREGASYGGDYALYLSGGQYTGMCYKKPSGDNWSSGPGNSIPCDEFTTYTGGRNGCGEPSDFACIDITLQGGCKYYVQFYKH